MVRQMTLDELCKPSLGQVNLNSNDLIDYFDISSVDNRYKKVTGFETYRFADAPSRARKAVNKNSILVSTVRPNLNAVAIFDRKTDNTPVVSTGFCVLDCKDDVNPRFVFYFCRSRSFINEMVCQATGASYPAVNERIVRNAHLTCYSKSEQDKISGELDSIASIIEDRTQELQKLDELIKARFIEMFGDPLTNSKGYLVKTLSEIAEYWNGLTYKPEDVADEGTIVLRSSNIQNATLDFADTVRVVCKIGDKKYVRNNDILMCSRNGSAKLVGKVALIKNLEEPMSFGAFMMIIRSAYFPYLMTYFQMPAFRTQITTGATTTINQITSRMLDCVKVPIPDMSSVNKFADFVNQVYESKRAVQAALNKTQLLFDSLMQEYFG